MSTPKLLIPFVTAGYPTKNRCVELLHACAAGGADRIELGIPFSDPLADGPVIQATSYKALQGGVTTGMHAASLTGGRPGVLHGSMSYLMQDEWGQVANTHSISAGLDYPGVGPEHSLLKDAKRVTYTAATDEEALHAFHQLSREEGIMPALESAHAVAFAEKLARKMKKRQILVVNISGRGDKDIGIVQEHEKP